MGTASPAGQGEQLRLTEVGGPAAQVAQPLCGVWTATVSQALATPLCFPKLSRERTKPPGGQSLGRGCYQATGESVGGKKANRNGEGRNLPQSGLRPSEPNGPLGGRGETDDEEASSQGT